MRGQIFAVLCVLLALVTVHAQPKPKEKAAKEPRVKKVSTQSPKAKAASAKKAKPKKIAKAKPSKIKPTKVSLTFEEPPRRLKPTVTQGKSKEKFFQTMAAPGRSSLPMIEEGSVVGKAPAPVPTPQPPSQPQPQVVINNHNNYDYDEPRVAPAQELSDHRSEEPVMLRSSTRVRARSSNRMLTLIPFGGAGYSQADIMNGSNNDPNIQSVDITGRAGFLGGVLMEFGQTRFSFQTGLIYLQEGTKALSSGTSQYGEHISIDEELAVHYIGLPLMAKLNLGTQNQTRINLRAGLMPAYTSSVEVTSNNASTSVTGTRTSSMSRASGTEGTRPMNVLAQAGAGVQMPIDSNLDFRVDFLWSRSLMSVNSEESGGGIFTQSFMGTVGLGIGI